MVCWHYSFYVGAKIHCCNGIYSESVEALQINRPSQNPKASQKKNAIGKGESKMMVEFVAVGDRHYNKIIVVRNVANWNSIS